MTDNRKDPREEVLTRAWRTAMKRYGFAMNEANMEAVRALARDAYDAGVNAARIDAADPLRAIMGEVANELEHILNWVPLGDKARTLRIRDLFVKIRTLTATEGGTDEEKTYD